MHLWEYLQFLYFWLTLIISRCLHVHLFLHIKYKHNWSWSCRCFAVGHKFPQGRLKFYPAAAFQVCCSWLQSFNGDFIGLLSLSLCISYCQIPTFLSLVQLSCRGLSPDLKLNTWEFILIRNRAASCLLSSTHYPLEPKAELK